MRRPRLHASQQDSFDGRRLAAETDRALRKVEGELREIYKKLNLLKQGVGLTFAAPSESVDAGDTSTEGTATTTVRSDHQHAVSTGTPTAVSLDAAPAEGVSTNLARADHQHGLPADTAGTLSIGGSNTEGVSTSVARADHEHAIHQITNRILGRTTAGTGSVEEITVAAPLTFSALTLGLDQSGVDHGTLAGLGDDDHTQYLRTDGTRALTGAWDSGTPNVTHGGNLTLDSGGPNLTVGDGTGNPLATFIKDTAGVCQVRFFDEATPNAGSWRLHHQTDEQFSLDRYNGTAWDEVLKFTNVDPSEARFIGDINGQNGKVTGDTFSAVLNSSISNSGEAVYWALDAGPAEPYFRDDNDVDHRLAYAATAWQIPLTVANVSRTSTYSTLAADGTNTAASHAADGSSAIQSIRFSGAGPVNTVAVWEGVLPNQYQGGGLTVELWLAGDGTASSAADFRVTVERQNAGFDINAASWGTEVACTGDTISGTQGVLVKATAALSSGVQMDSLAAGEPFRIRVVRHAGGYSGTVDMIRGLVRET